MSKPSKGTFSKKLFAKAKKVGTKAQSPARSRRNSLAGPPPRVLEPVASGGRKGDEKETTRRNKKGALSPRYDDSRGSKKDKRSSRYTVKSSSSFSVELEDLPQLRRYYPIDDRTFLLKGAKPTAAPGAPPSRDLAAPPPIPPKWETDLISLSASQLPDLSFFTEDKLAKLLFRIQQDVGGVPQADIHWYIKSYEKVFNGADLLDWLVSYFNADRRTCLDIANRLLFADIIFHVTDSMGIVDSKLFHYTFQKRSDDDKSTLAKLKKMASSADDSTKVPRKTLDPYLMTHGVVTPLPDYTDTFEKFWYIDRKSKVKPPDIGTELYSFVPNLVLRHFHQQSLPSPPPSSPPKIKALPLRPPSDNSHSHERPTSSSSSTSSKHGSGKGEKKGHKTRASSVTSRTPTTPRKNRATSDAPVSPRTRVKSERSAASLASVDEEEAVPKTALTESFFGCVQFVDISGFTPLAEKLSVQGEKGMEKLTQYLNDYFGKLIDLIISHGGDIVKFAGDALLAVWPTEVEEQLPSMVLLACQCAVQMQTTLHDYKVKEGVLKVHAGIGVGELTGLHVGGVGGRTEYLIAGSALDEMSICEKLAEPGEVYLSSSCWQLLTDRIVATHMGAAKEKDILEMRMGSIKMDGSNRSVYVSELELILQLVDPIAMNALNFRLEGVFRSIPKPTVVPRYDVPPACLTPYVPTAINRQLPSGLSSHIGGFRPVSVVFINLDLPFSHDIADTIQSAMVIMQEALLTYEGGVRQFLFDDKGSVLIGVFGVPPLAHEDDPLRAVKTAVRIHQELKNKLRIENSIGITSGTTFCGAVGSTARREYAVVGDIVNLSARLMAAAKGRVLVDYATYSASKSSHTFHTLEPIFVKGKVNAIPIYQPVSKKLSHESTPSLAAPARGGKRSNRVFVGRDQQMLLLLKAFRESQSVSTEKSGSQSPTSAQSTKESPRRPMLRRQHASSKSGGGDDKDENEAVTAIHQLLNASTTNVQSLKRNSSDLLHRTRTRRVLTFGAESDKPTPEQTETPQTCVVVTGEAGFGKSLLLRYLREKLVARGARVLAGSGNAIEMNTPYSAWREVFLEIIDYRKLSQSIPDKGDRANHICELVETKIPSHLSRHAPLISALLPLTIEENEITSQLSPDLRVEATKDLLMAMLESSSCQAILLDNCSWLDSASWGLALAVARNYPRILLVLATRPTSNSSQSQILSLPETREMVLGKLTKSQSMDLLRQRLKVKMLSREIENVVTKTQGNPMVLEELSNALQNSDFAVIDGDQCKIAPGKEHHLNKVFASAKPLVALVNTKLDRLDHGNSVLLQVASVVGSVVDVDLLTHLLKSEGVSDKDIKARVTYLIEANLIEHKKDTSQYHFVNTITSEIVYSQLMFSRRRDLHEAIAKWMELKEHYQQSMAPTLAHHWKFSENPRKAIFYYDMGGQSAMESFANREAIHLFSEAIALVSQHLSFEMTSLTEKINSSKNHVVLDNLDQADLGLLIQWERQVGECHSNLGKLDRATFHLERTLVLLRQPMPSRKGTVKVKYSKKPAPIKDNQMARAIVLTLNSLAKVYFYCCDKKAMRYCTEYALKTALAHELTGVLTPTYALCILRQSCEVDGSLGELLSLGQRSAEATASPLTQLNLNTGMFQSSKAMWSDAALSYALAKQAAQPLDDWRSMEEAVIFESTSLSIQSKFFDSLRHLDLALDSADRRGDIQIQLMAILVIAWNELHRGNPVAFFEHMDQAKLTLSSVDTETYIMDMTSKINYYGLKSLSYLYNGELQKALQSAQATEVLIGKTYPTAFFTFMGYMAVSEVYLHLYHFTVSTKRTGFQWSWDEALHSSKLHSLLSHSLGRLKKFGDIFLFAQARYHLLMYLFALCDPKSKVERSQAAFDSTLSISNKYSTTYEQALAIYIRGKRERDFKLVDTANNALDAQRVSPLKLLLCIQFDLEGGAITL